MAKFLLLTSSVLFVFFLSLQPIKAQNNITCHGGIQVATLIGDTLINGCLTASNITANNGAYGYFKKNNSQFPFASGIIMASGAITNAQGPNSSGSLGSSVGSGSDPDLTALVSGSSIQDACVIQFDFIPADNVVEFKYIFGSEEFPEYANSTFNDVFGFFLSGPGISGPYQNGAINIALLPNGQPVTINNVHNSNFYVAYPSSASNSAASYNGAVQYDGNTIVLTATATVQPCQTYHIKLAIGDRGDSVYDSGMFLESGSFTSGSVIEAFNISQFGGSSDLWEGCTNKYVVSRAPGSSLANPLVINVGVSPNSTATPGADYTPFPTQIVIPAGQMTDTIYYDAFNDGLNEGNESIILNLSTTCPCGNQPSVIKDTIWIFDAQRIKGGIQHIQTDFCGIAPPSSLTLHAECNLDTSQVTTVYYHWSTGAHTPTINITPQPGSTTYYVTMFDDCGNEVFDSITIKVSNMNFSINQVTNPTCHNSCTGSAVLTTTNNYPPFTYRYVNSQWQWWPDSVHVTTNGNLNNLCPGTYLVTVTDAMGCEIESSFTINNPPPLNHSLGIVEGNQTYCSNPGQLTLHAQSNISGVNYLWFNSSTQSSITFTPSVGVNNCWVKITDACGNIFQDTVRITVSNMQASASSSPDNGNCTGSAWASVNNGIPPYTYYWPEINKFGPEQYNLCHGMHTVNITDNIGCQITRQTYVQLNVSSSEIENSKNIVYPNPNTGGFYVDLGKYPISEYRIKLIDVIGKCVYDNIVNNNSLIEIKDIKPGTYFINISSDNDLKYVEKVIILEN